MTVSEFLTDSKLKTIDARILLEHTAGLSQSDIICHPEKELSEDTVNLLHQLSEKRNQGLPIEYIVHGKNFYNDRFYICEGVLIPQPDTEILVEKAIAIAKSTHKKAYRVLDLCSGSGCIGISVAKEIAECFDSFEVVFSDISPTAIECTKINAENILHNINYSVVQGDLFSNLEAEKFDLILTNPPYIASPVIPTLESDVQHEPALALDGGKDGLEIIERIMDHIRDHLNSDGTVLMEIGYDQGPAVSSLFIEHNLKEVCIFKDLGYRDRVVKGLY